MRSLRIGSLATILGIVLLACEPAMPHSNLNLVLRAFQKGRRIPVAFTEDGGDTSPELEWNGAPAGTQAFALVVDDPDAPVGTWVHWVLYDLPATTAKLDENQPRGAAAGTLGNGAKQGKNSWGRLGWNGPAPPRGKVHRYFFRLYALATPTGLAPGADRTALDRAMKGKILGEPNGWAPTAARRTPVR